MNTHEEESQHIVNKSLGGFLTRNPAALARFVAEVLAWNSSLNLVSRHDPVAACERLLGESLEWARKLDVTAGARIADVGSGAGFPGIAWAIEHPEARFILLDRRERRVLFLERVVRLLELPNAEVRAMDVSDGVDESLRAQFDLVSAMAVRDPATFAPNIEWMLRSGGRFSTTISRDRSAPDRVGRALHLLDLHAGQFGRYVTYCTDV
jgi:16S rRNA (guanine(527)-N(7))-methyltransferase RsmG